MFATFNYDLLHKHNFSVQYLRSSVLFSLLLVASTMLGLSLPSSQVFTQCGLRNRNLSFVSSSHFRFLIQCSLKETADAATALTQLDEKIFLKKIPLSIELFFWPLHKRIHIDKTVAIKRVLNCVSFIYIVDRISYMTIKNKDCLCTRIEPQVVAMNVSYE